MAVLMTTPPLHSSSNECLDLVLVTLLACGDSWAEMDEAMQKAKQAIEAHYATQLSEAYKRGFTDAVNNGKINASLYNPMKEGQE